MSKIAKSAPYLRPAVAGLFLASIFIHDSGSRCLGQAIPRASSDIDADELRPGLLAVYRSLTHPDAPSLTRIDAKPAFTWGLSTPQPRLPAGPFEATWSGVLLLAEKGPVRFGAYVGGEIEVTVDGTVVLRGQGSKPSTWIAGGTAITKKPGPYRLTIRFRAHANVPARVQIWWEGAGFAREPLTAARFRHVPGELPQAVSQEQWIARGRAAAGRLGCARCHHDAMPGIDEPPPGPILTNLVDRSERSWLLHWLDDPTGTRTDARMPALFTNDRRGFVERTLVADYLMSARTVARPTMAGDHRAGKEAFIGLGCLACHQDPEKPLPRDPDRYPFSGLGDRWTGASLAVFLEDPLTRYPDGRMPRLPLTTTTARNLAAFLLLNSPQKVQVDFAERPRPEEMQQVMRGLRVASARDAGAALIRQKGCARCHGGLGETTVASIPIPAKPPRVVCSGPRFRLDDETQKALSAYLGIARLENHPSPFSERQRLLDRVGCLRCHERDGDRAAPLEEIGRTAWTPFLYRLPFQRTPRLTQATLKFRHEYLMSTVKNGVKGVRPDWYSYRMPSFGSAAESIVAALAEGDGDEPGQPDVAQTLSPDAEIKRAGPALVGFEGYACIACHVWRGGSMGQVEPGAVGPELTTATNRVRREWFDRFLDDPARVHPGTPMPGIFRHGERASLDQILGGDPQRQKDAIWSYLSLGEKADFSAARPPLAIPPPGRGEPPLVGHIPLRLPDGGLVESICVYYDNRDVILYDVGQLALRNVYTTARFLRQADMWRTTELEGTPLFPKGKASRPPVLMGPKGEEKPTNAVFLGYDRLDDGVRVRTRLEFPSGRVEAAESIREVSAGTGRRIERHWEFKGMPAGCRIGAAAEVIMMPLQKEAASAKRPVGYLPGEGVIGPLQRPGYRALVYPRPKTETGEDRVMPSALAVSPRDGTVFVASLKLGELLVVRDPHDNGSGARFENFTHGFVQDVFGMLHDGTSLYVLERRNLARMTDTHGNGLADRFDRVAALPHSMGFAYDWAYGLVRDRQGHFLYTLAPHANAGLVGSGSLVRLTDGHAREIAWGFRNPLGWCAGPDGEIFFTDNQGEWVATNKLSHVVEGQFYGYPNHAQPEHARKPLARTAVWVPYDWARSINGVAFDTSGGKFGPFAGQFFLAELMHGGAIVRAQVEKVNGIYQGACFPFWGKGLLGPLVLAFDPRGRLWVGAITTPAWMGQPDRGALFRIDFTGSVPFEIQAIHARPQGFRLVFTAPVEAASARALASYQVESYRYEYTGAYGSPELDRKRVTIERIESGPDGRSVDLVTAPLVKDHVYAITAAGVRSSKGEALVHPTGAYTLNEVPGR